MKPGPLHAAAMLCLALSALLCVPAAAADAGGDAEAIEELDEIVVRGKRLRDEIVAAEDAFFKLFNEVNKDPRYEMHCVYLNLPDSRIQTRACIPGFVANAMADWAPFKARCQPPVEASSDEFSCLDRNRDGRLSLQEAEARWELAANFMFVDADHDGRISFSEFPRDMPPPTALYQPPPPDLVLVEGTKRWYAHMMEVTSSDPRLKEMADRLGGLYYELRGAQRRYDEIAEQIPRRQVNRGKYGPRR